MSFEAIHVSSAGSIAHDYSFPPVLVERDGPPKPWCGFNYTAQDTELHSAERESISVSFIISAVFPLLAITAVTARFVAARRRQAGRTIDDWIILAALIPAIGSPVWLAVTYYVDKDRIIKSFFEEAEKGDFTELDDPLGNANALRWGPGVITTFYMTALALTKISILLLYRRLFDKQTVRRTVIIGIAIVLSTWVAFVVPSLLGLANVSGVSDGVIFRFVLGFAYINLISNVVLLAFPLPFVWSLNLSAGRRLQLIGVFLLATVYIISSAVRLAFLMRYSDKLSFIFKHRHNWYATFSIADFARDWWMTWIWAVIDPCISIVAACLPTLRPIFERRREPKLSFKWATGNRKNMKKTRSNIRLHNSSVLAMGHVEMNNQRIDPPNAIAKPVPRIIRPPSRQASTYKHIAELDRTFDSILPSPLLMPWRIGDGVYDRPAYLDRDRRRQLHSSRSQPRESSLPNSNLRAYQHDPQSHIQSSISPRAYQQHEPVWEQSISRHSTRQFSRNMNIDHEYYVQQPVPAQRNSVPKFHLRDCPYYHDRLAQDRADEYPRHDRYVERDELWLG